MRRSAFLAGVITAVLASGTGVAAQSKPPEEPGAAPWPSSELAGAGAIAAGPGMFLAVGGTDGPKGGSRTWTSSDGVTWTLASTSPLRDGPGSAALAAFRDGFVALGNPDRKRITAWTTTDGTTWERATIEGAKAKGLEAYARDVVAGPAGLLALGDFFGQDLSEQRLWTSGDGKAWAVGKLPVEKGVVWESLAALPDGYLLVGMATSDDPPDLLWRSSDGVAWEPVPGPADGWVMDAAVGDDGSVVGVGGTRVPSVAPAVWVSRDLTGWELVHVGANAKEEDELRFVDRVGSGFVALGSASGCPDDPADFCPAALVLASGDGLEWAASDGPDGVPGPDAGIGFVDRRAAASVGDVTVLLGGPFDGPAQAWVMPAVPVATDASASPEVSVEPETSVEPSSPDAGSTAESPSASPE